MAEKDQSESPLESMRKRLYSSEKTPPLVSSRVAEKPVQAPERWQHDEPVLPNAGQQPPRQRMSGAALFLISAGAFFVIAGIAAGVVLFLGGRSVSADNVEIIVEGPTTIEGGETVSLLVTIKNNNPVAISDGVLNIDFPEGAYTSPDQSEPLLFKSEEIGTIEPGASVPRTIRVSFFGSERQKLVVPFTLEYKATGSSAVFVKNRDYEMVLGTSPVSISVSTLKEVSSGQSFTTTLTVRSNAATALENVGVRIDNPFPFGYSIASTTPAAISGNVFPLGRLEPGEEKNIRITGKITGVDGEERVFHFTAGALGGSDEGAFAVSYTTQTAELTIAKPFLAVGLSLNRLEEPEVIVASESEVRGALTWANTLAVPITDGTLTVALSGSGLDPLTVDTEGGFFRSSDKTILFSKESSAGLRQLEPGDTGSGSFVFSTKSGPALWALRNPTMTVSVSVSGRRIGEGKVPEIVSSTITRLVKVATGLSIKSSVVRTAGPFTNTGPWPPVADQETTYTVLLSAGNTVNSAANVSARMKLPTYVRFMNVVSSGSTIVYNETTREVTWTVGDMVAGSQSDAAFQIALLPSTSQKGKSPVLVSEQAIAGFDRFVKQEVAGAAPALSTQTPSDPAYEQVKGTVK